MIFFAHAGHAHETTSSIVPTLIFFGILLAGAALLAYYLFMKPRKAETKKTDKKTY